MMEYLRTVFDRTRIRLLIASGISLLVGLILLFAGVYSTSKLKDQQIASRWGDSKDYAQVTAFFSEMAGFSEDSVRELSYKINNKLLQDSLTTGTEEGARSWIYSYSAFGEVMAVSNNDSTSVKAIGIGGDYFLFHPLKLVSGSYFNSEYVMKDLVLLDVETAWRLFGSTDIEGQVIEIGGTRHIVSGVVAKEEGRLNTIAGNDEPMIYLSYESLKKNGSVSYINSFEALMPNPISSYAYEAVKGLIPVSEKRYELIENTGRFNFVKLLQHAKKYGTRGMNAKAIVYPYWENVARGMEDYLAPVAVVGTLCFSFSALTVIYILLRMIKKRTIHLVDFKNFVEDKVDDRRRKRRREIEIEELD